jgi:hypothetical protein
MTVSELPRRTVALGLACLLLAPAAALADAPTPQDRTLAESLFRDAKKLVLAKKYDQACPMLAESQRLDPGGGTLLNLASCHAAAGLTATAWGEFSEALAAAKRDGRADRIKAAQAEIAALEPKLSRLTVVASADVSPPPQVDVDARPLPIVMWGRPFPIDPGSHVVTAHAPGRVTFEVKVDVHPNADPQTITVPPLAAALAPEAAIAVQPVAPAPPEPPAAPHEDSGHGGRRTAGFVAGGVGVVGLGVGIGLALHAIALHSDSNHGCTPGCTATAVSDNNDARTFANVANVGFGVGIVGLGVGTYLVVTSRSGSQAAKVAAAIPFVTVGPHGSGLTWGTAF